MSEGPGEWVDKDAFVMPVLPEELEIDPVLAGLIHTAAFLELSGDDAVNPDWAVEALEHVGVYFQRLPAKRVEDLERQLQSVLSLAQRQGWAEEATEFIETFLEGFGIENEDS